jgi:prefoldin subunit 5
MTEISPQEFGRMQAEVENLRESVDRLESAVEKLTAAISEVNGGKKTLIALGTLTVAISSGITWLATHIKYTP